MKYLLACAALALTSACTLTQQPTATPASSAEATMKRPNLVVSDLERSIALYEGILGFAASDISESSADSFSYPVFKIPKDQKIRSVVMDDTQDQRAFALTEVAGMELPKLPERPLMSAYVIGVTDLPGKIAAVEAQGLWTSPSKTAEGADFRFIEQAFTDYDGHLIVLYEPLP